MHDLHLDVEEQPRLIYVFYETDEGLVNNFSISLQSARRRNRQAMSDEEIVGVMQQYPAARDARLLAVEHPQRGLTRWLTQKEVIFRLSTSRNTLYRWVQRGLLHPSVINRRNYFDPNEVEAFLRSNIRQDNGRCDYTGAPRPPQAE